MLKVTVAEMDRQVIKQLGINLSGSFGYGSAVVNFNTTNPFPVNGTPSSSVSGGFKGLTATLQAMEQAGVVRTLAEPTLTAISGESAHFLVGRAVPVPNTGRNRIAARDSISELRCRSELHPCGAVGRSHQPARGNGSLAT